MKEKFHQESGSEPEKVLDTTASLRSKLKRALLGLVLLTLVEAPVKAGDTPDSSKEPPVATQIAKLRRQIADLEAQEAEKRSQERKKQLDEWLKKNFPDKKVSLCRPSVIVRDGSEQYGVMIDGEKTNYNIRSSDSAIPSLFFEENAFVCDLAQILNIKRKFIETVDTDSNIIKCSSCRTYLTLGNEAEAVLSKWGGHVGENGVIYLDSSLRQSFVIPSGTERAALKSTKDGDLELAIIGGEDTVFKSEIFLIKKEKTADGETKTITRFY